MNTIRTPIWKIAATVGGVGLTASATWLNAQHVAASESWASPLVFAGIFVTLCAALAPPLAERAGKSGQPLKALMIWTFFGLALCFSLSSSIARSSGYASGKVASVEAANDTRERAEKALADAIKQRDDECATGIGSQCRKLRDKVEEARQALATVAPVQSTDPGSERVAAVLGVQEASVQLYAPLFLPLGLELGGFIFLATGLALARRRREREEVDHLPLQDRDQEAGALLLVDRECEGGRPPLQGRNREGDHLSNDRKLQAGAVRKSQPIAKRSPVVAKLLQDAAKPVAKQGAIGTRAYYMARLEAEFPQLTTRVRNGELSCFAASVQAGLRKAPKARKWDASEYLKVPVAESV